MATPSNSQIHYIYSEIKNVDTTHLLRQLLSVEREIWIEDRKLVIFSA